MENDAQLKVEPIRQLAMYLAAYVDGWEDLVDLHGQVMAQAPAGDASTLVQIASPLLLAHLQQREASTATAQDTLSHIIAQRGLETLCAQSTVGRRDEAALFARIEALSKTSQSIVGGYYRHHLRDEALAAFAGVAVKDVAQSLCRARAELDWHSQDGVWQAKDGESLLPSLIQEFIAGRMDQASRSLLNQSLSRDLTYLAGFERQWRLHLLLLASCAQLPFPVLRADASNHRQKGISRTGRTTRSSHTSTAASNRLTSTTKPSLALWYMVGACCVVVGLAMLSLKDSSPSPQKADTSRPAEVLPLPKPSQQADVLPVAKPLPPMVSTVKSDPAAALPVAPRIEPIAVAGPNIQTTSDTPTALPVAPPLEPIAVTEIALPPAGDEAKPLAIVPPPTVTPPPAVTPPPMVDPPPAPMPPVVVVPRTIDFMPLLDVDRDAVSGEWSMDGRKKILRVGGADKYFTLQLPYIAPEEYDLSVSFIRREARGDVDCIVTQGTTQCVAAIGAFEDALTGFSMVGGKKVNQNKTQGTSPPIINGKRYQMTVSVRKRSMAIYVDEVLVSSWDPAKGALAMNPQWPVKNKKALGIGIYTGVTDFLAIEVREVSGPGRLLAPALGAAGP